MNPKPTPSNKKPVRDLAGDIYEIVCRLVVRAEEEPGIPSRLAMKAYVQWSKNNLQPLDAAIEDLARRVRDTTMCLARRSTPELRWLSFRRDTTSTVVGPLSPNRHGRLIAELKDKYEPDV